MLSLYGTARLSCVDYAWLHRFRPVEQCNLCTGLPLYHGLIMDDYTVLGRWANSSLYGTARAYHVLIMYDYTVLGPLSHINFIRKYPFIMCWLYCFRPLGHIIFVRDCPLIMCWSRVITIGCWAMSFLCTGLPVYYCFRSLGNAMIFVRALHSVLNAGFRPLFWRFLVILYRYACAANLDLYFLLLLLRSL